MVDIDVLRKEWYRLNAVSTEGMSPRDLGFHVGMKSGIIKAMNLLNIAAGDAIIGVDKEYKLAPLADADAFAHQRKYTYIVNEDPSNSR
jgi:hypothetical protein